MVILFRSAFRNADGSPVRRRISRCRTFWLTTAGFGLICGSSNNDETSAFNMIPYSSQSVARMNTSWSNDVKKGPRAIGQGRGGFGGRDDLEKTSKYRNSGDAGRGSSQGYGMVFDVPGAGSGSRRKRSRSREKHGDTTREQRRRRSKSPVRDRRRSRSRSRDERRSGYSDRDRRR
jgi:hypothetical protein